VLVVADEVVAEYESRDLLRVLLRAAVREDDVPALTHDIVLDGDVTRTLADQRERAGASPLPHIDVVEEVVGEPHAARRSRGKVRILADNLKPAAGVTNEVLADRHILDADPRRPAVLISGGQQDGVS